MQVEEANQHTNTEMGHETQVSEHLENAKWGWEGQDNNFRTT